MINAKTEKPFSGIISITKHGKVQYLTIKGFANKEKKTPLERNDQFVIGSISKQFTAALILRAYDEGKVSLHTPIRKYLPNLKLSWADTVTIHQLLTHTHGIVSLNKALSFRAGTQYAYSQIGYDLMAQILESVNNKSFSVLADELFKKCVMLNTFHPDLKKYKNLVKGYSEQENGKLVFETATFENYPAAGGFISTVDDLIKWNECLYSGKLFKANTFEMMKTKQPLAIRQHPLFGRTEYGYGITVDDKEGLLQLGQTGYTPGFISMNFYFPKTQTSLIILDNFVWYPEELDKAFKYHTEILKFLRNSLK
ncbi:serine hydrolase [Emticicia aquatilis]|uniref:Serine hydrolase n=1 Tax=Emticicia aquatilis TaxID=1537369 RepID=A0A916YKQ4_9BACT|nr:serine hydrolase domain-containing protein [Emticicia aquatilis]GGD48932.1 serine hydrolase [Emticicia aquatilis]